MPIITLKDKISNTSLQIGDDAYFVTLDPNGFANEPTKIGKITGFTSNSITVFSLPSPAPAQYDFIMFSKNRAVNNNSLLGYYAEVKLKNDSTEKAELFALSSEVVESSK
jgi:hypothetical protein